MLSKSVRILLVEDNEDDVIMTLESFEEADLANIISVVEDGEEAMSYLRREGKYQDAILPDLILLDINMPKKNGLEVLKEIKSDPSLRHLPVIMLTTSERQKDILNSYTEGASAFIPKPVAFDNFINIAKQFSLYWTIVARIPQKS